MTAPPSEAINYVLSLLRTGRLAPADIWAYHHGDILRDHVVNALSPVDKSDLEYLQSLPEKYKDAGRPAIVVCHSMSTNWKYPEPMWSAGEASHCLQREAVAHLRQPGAMPLQCIPMH